MSQQVHPFLMFTGQAEEAMDFYISLFPSAKVQGISRYGVGEHGAAGSIKRALFSIGGQSVMCTDSVVEHDFTFTPSFSLFVTCESEDEIQALSEALAEGGTVFMPLGNYGSGRQYAWVGDRFGVSWQLSLEDEPATSDDQKPRDDT